MLLAIIQPDDFLNFFVVLHLQCLVCRYVTKYQLLFLFYFIITHKIAIYMCIVHSMYL